MVSVRVASDGGAPIRATEEAYATRERRLEGDHYHGGKGHYCSNHPGLVREVSLIEEETMKALKRDHVEEVGTGEPAL